MTKKLPIFITTVTLFFSIVGIAKATLIAGIATNGSTSTAVGNYDDDSIEFFIPLSGSPGTYGVGGYGETADTVTLAGDELLGPLETMFLYFWVPTGEYGHTLTLTLTDGDLTPDNDPFGFFEKLTLTNDYGLPGGTYTDYDNLDSLLDVQVVNNDPLTNNDISIIFTGLNLPSGDNWIELGFEAWSDGLGDGDWTNTVEKLVASLEVSPVPEPATMLLLGSGLIGLVGFRRKFKKS